MSFPVVLPSVPAAKPGQIPSPGQWAKYQFDDGRETAAIIRWVGTSVVDRSPDGKYVNVAAIIVGAPKEKAGGPFSADGWLFRIADATILYIPCGPPWPH